MKGRILRSSIHLPGEDVEAGPRGARVEVVAGSAEPWRPVPGPGGDPFRNAPDEVLLSDPRFHAQNVYAIVMATLARFEQALGRRVSWGFPGHRILALPHAFPEANAYYSPAGQSLQFGYFQGRQSTVYCCLCHDVIAHETAHALLDGLRNRYMNPSSPDQAAFHEGFADLVALLSVFAQPDVIEALAIPRRDWNASGLRRSALFGMAEQMGQEIAGARGGALRRSAELSPSPHWLLSAGFQQPHRRGEVLVAAVMNAFLHVWLRRLESLNRARTAPRRMAEEGAAAAARLLQVCIRGLDYCPAVHIEFPDYLSAVLTADSELYPEDSQFRLRQALLESFQSYGIHPATRLDRGAWEPPDAALSYRRTHHASLRRDPEEVHAFLWENRKALGIRGDAFTRVISVRPCERLAEDGFVLRESVAEYVQTMALRAAELKRLDIAAPPGMPPGRMVVLEGGGTLVFDEYARLKYHIRNKVDNAVKQSERLAYLWRNGFLAGEAPPGEPVADLHRRRAAPR